MSQIKSNNNDFKKTQKKVVVKITKSLVKDMKNKYSENLEKKHEIQMSINKRIKDNQSVIDHFLSQNKNSITNSINMKLLDTCLFLFKIITCSIILPLISYIKMYPDKILDPKNLEDFFLNQNLEKLTSIISKASIEHPLAIAYLSHQFIYNPLGKILMKFSLFKGIFF